MTTQSNSFLHVSWKVMVKQKLSRAVTFIFHSLPIANRLLTKNNMLHPELNFRVEGGVALSRTVPPIIFVVFR